jgi:hypothetical protein
MSARPNTTASARLPTAFGRDRDAIRQPGLLALVPCAGTGSRSGADLPKQYVTIAGRTVVGHTLSAMARVDRLQTSSSCSLRTMSRSSAACRFPAEGPVQVVRTVDRRGRGPWQTGSLH